MEDDDEKANITTKIVWKFCRDHPRHKRPTYLTMETLNIAFFEPVDAF